MKPFSRLYRHTVLFLIIFQLNHNNCPFAYHSFFFFLKSEKPTCRLFPTTCERSNTHQSLIANKSQQLCSLFFFSFLLYNRNFISDICILTNTKWRGKIKRKKIKHETNEDSVFTWRGADTSWYRCGRDEASHAVSPRCQNKSHLYAPTCLHTNTHTQSKLTSSFSFCNNVE